VEFQIPSVEGHADRAGYNALVLEARTAVEFAASWPRRRQHPFEATAMRRAPRRTALRCAWPRIVDRGGAHAPPPPPRGAALRRLPLPVETRASSCGWRDPRSRHGHACGVPGAGGVRLGAGGGARAAEGQEHEKAGEARCLGGVVPDAEREQRPPGPCADGMGSRPFAFPSLPVGQPPTTLTRCGSGRQHGASPVQPECAQWKWNSTQRSDALKGPSVIP
jgi:hypothetical protein